MIMNIWKKPTLICIVTEDLLCKVKAKANSLPKCDLQYAEQHACPEISVGDTWGDDDGFGGDIGCGILSQCTEVGPLMGCSTDNVYCSELFPVFS